MLFNSLVFIAGFMPLAYGVLALSVRFGNRCAVSWLGLASIAFYAWAESRYVPLLLASVIGNYVIGMAIVRARSRPSHVPARMWLWTGLTFDLGLLAYFKYAGLLVGTLESAFDVSWGFTSPVLPIGISFFTFTQIAFLVDAHVGKVTDRDPMRYLLFVSYFPHLIAGPILHHAEMMPQFAKPDFGRLSIEGVMAGGAIFLIGLFKKVVLADGVAQYVAPVFDATDGTPATGDAWVGVLGYTFQIYFDFSGYSDMAIGLARMMGVTLPENFNSPYKATSIVDFWRRWHMSLSVFLRDYLYIQLGGNRHGVTRRYINLFLTMLLGGLWHGASWTFLVWGALHGVYLSINHMWNTLAERVPWMRTSWLAPIGRALTLLSVVVGWVFFRASDFTTAFSLLGSMAGNAAGVPASIAYSRPLAMGWIAVCAALAFLAPNTMQWRRWARSRWQTFQAACGESTRSWVWLACGAMSAAVLVQVLMAESAAGRSPFIYFSF